MKLRWAFVALAMSASVLAQTAHDSITLGLTEGSTALHGRVGMP